MPAPCPYCGKDCGNDYNVKKHVKACYKRPPDRPKAPSGTAPAAPAGTPSTVPLSPAWPTYKAPQSTPTQGVGVPTAGGGRVVSSGLWKTIASLENAFLSKGKCICTDEQDAAMDQNMQAILGRSGQPVSPWAGFLVGLIGIFFTPIVVEFAPMLKQKASDWWDKQKEKKEASKNDNRSQPSTPGPQPVG